MNWDTTRITTLTIPLDFSSQKKFGRPLHFFFFSRRTTCSSVQRTDIQIHSEEICHTTLSTRRKKVRTSKHKTSIIFSASFTGAPTDCLRETTAAILTSQ